MKKKVSVIVPIYNVEEYLENCINSICSQTYKNIEILLIDDGSTDGSGKLCDQLAELDARIKVFHHINKGVVAARGFGISCAEGEYISFIDGDDWIEPNMIEVLVERIGNADMISSGLYKYIALEQYVKRVDGYEDGTYEGIKYENFLKNMIYDMETHAFQRLTPWLCNKLFRKDLLQDAYEKLDEKIRYAEDAVCLYLYLLKCHSIVIIKDIFYHYLYRETSACHKVNDRMLIDINYGYLVLKDIFAEHKFGMGNENVMFCIE